VTEITNVPGVARILYHPLTSRPTITWPNGAHVALWVVPNIEHYQFRPAPTDFMRPWPRVPVPDVAHYSYYDYGNRIGFWRLAEVLDHHGVRATTSLNVAVLDMFPEIREAIVSRNWGIMSHGLFNTSYTFGMSEAEEREFFRDNVDTVKRHTGRDLKGMLGPAGSVTPNTMRLMAEFGLTYSADWLIDDQPFPIVVPSGRLVGVPYSNDVNDDSLMAMGFGASGYEAEDFVQICKDQFDQLYAEGSTSGRVMCIALHAYVIGQPHRIAYLDEALSYVLGHDKVWLATGDEIADYYLENYYDAALAHEVGK
jgi:peptidoglycan/xylan/chitin deacetylase (PgdA/CDA1 family)